MVIACIKLVEFLLTLYPLDKLKLSLEKKVFIEDLLNF